MHEEGNPGRFCAIKFTATLAVHGMLKVGYAEDSAAMLWHRRAASKGDGFPPFERKPRARGAFSSLLAVMTILFLGLLSEMG